MPHESSQQPFADPTPRSTDDTKLVAEVLGTTEAAEMNELLGQTDSDKPEHQPQDLELTESEDATTQKAEQELNAEQRRDQYIEWAEGIRKNEAWVDKTFIFEIDGKVRVEGDLVLSNTRISELPPALYKVEGELHLTNSQITKIGNIPDSVTFLFLNNNPIESLDPLVGKKMEFLSIAGIKATTIPEGIEVNKIILNPSQTELIADARSKGYEIIF